MDNDDWEFLKFSDLKEEYSIDWLPKYNYTISIDVDDKFLPLYSLLTKNDIVKVIHTKDLKI